MDTVPRLIYKEFSNTDSDNGSHKYFRLKRHVDFYLSFEYVLRKEGTRIPERIISNTQQHSGQNFRFRCRHIDKTVIPSYTRHIRISNNSTKCLLKGMKKARYGICFVINAVIVAHSCAIVSNLQVASAHFHRSLISGSDRAVGRCMCVFVPGQ